MGDNRWLLLEPYYDGSHRALADGLVRRYADRIELWSLPARKWKWRLRGSSFHFARRYSDEAPEVNGLFASSMCNLAELRALLPAPARSLPAVVYFHENQIAYPAQHFDRRDHHFAFTQMHAAAAAECVLFNSEYNRRTFLDGVETILGKMPDHRPDWLPEAIAEKSSVLPVPLELAEPLAREPERGEPTHIVWNHRWEHDKGPRLLLDCVRALLESGVAFELSVVGQSFQTIPEEFAVIEELARPYLRCWGFVENRDEYDALLRSAHVVLSTAEHEFQGLAVLEAAAAGATPLVPDDLAYREIWPESLRSPRAELPAALVRAVREWSEAGAQTAREVARRYDWEALGPRWDEVLAGPAR